jgi:purine operon repressor
MDRLQRNERIAAMVKLLSDAPNKIFTLGTFTEMFGSAKSTISEDIDIVQGIFNKLELGSLETISGASGGVRFIQSLGSTRTNEVLDELCRELSVKERILPGGYMYMLDIIYNPGKVRNIASILAGHFINSSIDYVITVETKGIPLAFTTAKLLNVPLVIVRHYNEATDGASVNINYVSGSSKKIQTMVLSLRSLKRNSRLLFIDDFMKGGGTAKGIMDLAKEFECEVVGIGVMVETSEPSKKMIENCFSLLKLYDVNEEEGLIDIRPNIRPKA